MASAVPFAAGPSARPMTSSPSRAPSSARHHADAYGSTRPKETPKASASPSKKKLQLKKSRLPEVGATIRDIENNTVHVTGRCLGQGGFARVYEVRGPDGKAMAFKAIMKEALLHQKKNRQKVLAEILIHRSLNHPNIVNFVDLFQDDANIYFKLELCNNGNMNEMVRTRGHGLLDEEARFYMIQIIAGTKYMHVNHVIHRDLKLGNIFMDANMNLKIGDFGLAALLKDPEERKKTMCGTPNYIAPEILYDGNNTNGHSFEVDIWAVGVILYTLLAGKPPFQTSSVQEIYEKIKRNEYTIPSHVHPDAAALITSILTPDPSQRPSLVEIMNHAWFTAGSVPLSIPATGTKATPKLKLPRTAEEAMHNLQVVKEAAGWRDDADVEMEEEELAEEQRRQSAKEKRRAAEKAEQEREVMDKEFELAIQPGQSLSSFLSMGRKPLSKAPDVTGPLRPKRATSTGLSKQLSALSLSRQQGNSVQTASVGGKGGMDDLITNLGTGDKENAAHGYGPNGRMMPPPAASAIASTRSRMVESAYGAEDRRTLNQKARLVAAMANNGSSSSLSSVNSGRPESRMSAQQHDIDEAGQQANLDMMVQNLGEALDAYQRSARFVPSSKKSRAIRIAMEDDPDDLNSSRHRPQTPRSYIICWLDEMEKYGLGYALSDGAIGVYLKDDSSITINAAQTHFEVAARLHGPVASLIPKPDTYAVAMVDTAPRDAIRKSKILSYFQQKINARLEGLDMPLLDRSRTSDIPYVWRWYRCMQAIVFRLSTTTVQFNFYDHIKLLFSHSGLVLTAIVPGRDDPAEPQRLTWTIEEFMDIAEKGRSAREVKNEPLPVLSAHGTDSDSEAEHDRLGVSHLAITSSEERRLVRSLLSKVRYARETMLKMATRDAANNATVTPTPITNTASRTRTQSTATTLVRSNSGQSINSLSSARRQAV